MRPSEDEIKKNIGTASCFTYIGAAFLLHWWNFGLFSLYSLRFLAFLVIGMFAAPLTVGVASYVVFKVFDVVAKGRERIEVSGAFVSFILAVGGTIYAARSAFHWFYET